MMRYIALLRGVNVGGKKSVAMADLVRAFESLRFSRVRPYIQSGSIVFDAESHDAMGLAKAIEQKLRETIGSPVPVIIRRPAELETIVRGNPFVGEPGVELTRLHVTFLAEMPDPELTREMDLKKEENERFVVADKEVYLYLPNGYARTKLNNAVFEKKFRTAATTRNWRTVKKLLEISKEEEPS
jgi:uncharacterized protein (DUF1697 family)